MSGYAVDQWVATPGGVKRLEELAGPRAVKPVVELRLSDGSQVRCTPDHPFLTKERGLVKATDLGPSDRLVRSIQYTARSECSHRLPAQARAIAADSPLPLPLTWDEDLAHYVGWLVGDGSFTPRGAVTVYGSAVAISQTMPAHLRSLQSWTLFTPKPSVQANRTMQLRSMRRQFVDYLCALGVVQEKSARKVVPASIFTAPEEALTAFMRGLFDADGCVVNDVGKGTRYVGLGSKAEGLVVGVQTLLLSLGISSRIYQTAGKKDCFQHTRKDGRHVTYSSRGPSYDLRITGRSLREFAVLIDFGLEPKRQKLLGVIDHHGYYATDESVRLQVAPLPAGVAQVALTRSGQWTPPLGFREDDPGGPGERGGHCSVPDSEKLPRCRREYTSHW
ncbi:LAGLIDADG family homing endonuclease [Ornithinimicrobium sufpigmenti]|uniref:LAGLIDADG family homing endonuclease n=1 Tax=Ornithinimicrobium sufpigmenti TaxID=2508882 RepID=UPI001035971E|nr:MULTISPECIES: LAGLIDADG family homing endonuclease [unclassified Ornithinimicrobium]